MMENIYVTKNLAKDINPCVESFATKNDELGNVRNKFACIHNN